ncbi:MAG: mechanosensitive ion channel family protein [Labilithrix sp.]|nr:mechanosensitive ion channel family protein [Labilithrix sp.]MCW5814958.1 mechanosensitive ion channel family protein [Labilithrix sp.]
MRGDLTWGLGLFAAIVVVAGLVNRFRPAQRQQIRRLVILFLLHVAALGLHHGLAALGEDTWATRALVASELLKAFTLVNLGSTGIFAVLLPAAGVMLPMIASDLLVGVGYIGSTLGVLSTHGLNPSGALASAAVVSAVLAISLQSTLGNILGGVALQLDGSIKEGDWVQLADGKQGKVRAVRWRHTVLETRDWSTIIVPNALLLANNIMLLGKRDGKPTPQRMWLYFNVDFRYAPSKVIDAVNAALVNASIPNVARDPVANCVCIDFGREPGQQPQSFATYGVRYWVNDMGATDGTGSLVRTRVFTALRRADIPFAMPANTMWVQVEDDARKQRKRTERHEARVNALRSVPLFRSLTDEEIETLAEGLGHVIYTPGEVCTRQGAVAHWLYILAEGTVEIRTRFDPDGPGPMSERTTTLTKLTAPDVFGEMGLITGEPRTADVVAVTDVACFRLDRATFERVLLERPEIAQELSERLAHQRTELVGVREGLDETSMKKLEANERDRILKQIRSFFSM